MHINTILKTLFLLLICLCVTEVLGDLQGSLFGGTNEEIPIAGEQFISGTIITDEDDSSPACAQNYINENEHGYMVLDEATALHFADMYNQDKGSAINPTAYAGFSSANLQTSVDLSSHVPYTSSTIALRDQGYCGNCWAWAATGVVEVAHSVQNGIKNQLSVQYVNSKYNSGTGTEYACCGGFADDFVTFYQGSGNDMFIPWSNSGASYADGQKSCGQSTARPASQITTTPNYPFTSLSTYQITTTGVSRSTAINNIKSVLNQNKAIWIGFYWYDNAVDFQYAWSQGASYEYNPVTSVGSSGGLAGHAMTIIGYQDPNNDGTGYWIVMNSWGNRNNDPYLPGTIRFEMDMDYSAVVPGYSYMPISMYYVYDVTFTSTDPAPTVTSITPASGENTGTVSISNLAGTNFKTGATVKLSKSGYTDIAATSVVVTPPTTITCTLDLTNKQPGTWDVVVTNNDGQSGTKTGAFTITGNPVPTPGTYHESGSLSYGQKVNYGPYPVPVGATQVSFVLGGPSGADYDLYVARGRTPTVSDWDYRPYESDADEQVIISGPQSGNYYVMIHAYSGSGSYTLDVTVTGGAGLPAPTVTSITPASGENTGTVSISNLAGTNFQSGATVKLTRTGATDIAGTGVTYVSASKLTCSFNLAGATTGSWNVVVTNPDGQSDTLENAFTISSITSDFSYWPKTGVAPLKVYFSDKSTGYPPPTSWVWDFNNNGITDATGQNVCWTFSTPGTYLVRLTVGNGLQNETIFTAIEQQ